MRNGVFPAISVNKDVAIISDCYHHSELVSPEGTQEGKNTCHLAAIRQQPLPVVNLSKGNSGCENTGYWPQMRMKGMISVSLHSRIFPSLVQFSRSVMSEDAAHQATLSIANARSLLKLMSIESVIPSNHLIPSAVPFSSCLQSFPESGSLSMSWVFTKELALCIRWPKYWSFSFNISPSNEYSGLISFRIHWFDLFAVPGTLKSLLQHHNSKASILQCSALFMVQFSHSYMTTGKTIALTIQIFVGKVMSLSEFVIAFLPRSKCLLISWLRSLYIVILEPKKIVL